MRNLKSGCTCAGADRNPGLTPRAITCDASRLVDDEHPPCVLRVDWFCARVSSWFALHESTTKPRTHTNQASRKDYSKIFAPYLTIILGYTHKTWAFLQSSFPYPRFEHAYPPSLPRYREIESTNRQSSGGFPQRLYPYPQSIRGNPKSICGNV